MCTRKPRIKEEISDFLQNNSSFVKEYLERNPDVLEDIVLDVVDEATIKGWRETIQRLQPNEQLIPLRVNYMKVKNTKAHCTENYENKNLVIRRGAKFMLRIVFKNRFFNQTKDKVFLEFGTGENPTASNNTLFRLPVGSNLDEPKWSSKLVKVNDRKKRMKVEVNIPADAIVGKYQVNVETNTWVKNELKVKKISTSDVIVLFNPFSKDDDVYMAEEDRRKEYVLNDTGIIYYGQHYDIGGMQWLFGQFEPGILDIALKLLREAPNVEKNPVKCTKKRSSAVYCSRTLSAMINVQDDNGVLFGNWSGDYEGGKRPTYWNGSVKILRQWNDGGMAEVKFGQCWVFSGVLTTVLRALGIPARSVTNFKSAHDTDSTMTIDRYINDKGDEVLSKGSIWNFHVWNEAWFRRPDLPKGYDGWQAVDATPQEESDGVYQCGPAPVKAIKNGEIYLGYDTNFLFGEVNADRLTWKFQDSEDASQLYRREKDLVGRNISTKAVGKDAREDITHDYKHPEGSTQEREVFDRAYALGKRVFYHEDLNVIKDEGDVAIDISTVGKAVNGQTLTISVKVRNHTKVKKTGIISTAITTVLHNGQRKTLIKKEKVETELNADNGSSREIKVLFSDYGRHLVDNSALQVFTTVRVKETNNFYVDSHDVDIKSPDCLAINCPDEVQANKDVDVSFTFANPLPVTLTAGVFSIEGNGVVADSVTLSEPIPPNSTIKTKSMKMRFQRCGERTVIADFDSNEILNIKGKKKINVV